MVENPTIFRYFRIRISLDWWSMIHRVEYIVSSVSYVYCYFDSEAFPITNADDCWWSDDDTVPSRQRPRRVGT